MEVILEYDNNRNVMVAGQSVVELKIGMLSEVTEIQENLAMF